jgi:hypothetical protein
LERGIKGVRLLKISSIMSTIINEEVTLYLLRLKTDGYWYTLVVKKDYSESVVLGRGNRDNGERRSYAI